MLQCHDLEMGLNEKSFLGDFKRGVEKINKSKEVKDLEVIVQDYLPFDGNSILTGLLKGHMD